MASHPAPLDLRRPRDLGQILNDAFRVYSSNFNTFLILAFGVVIPVEIAVQGVALGSLWSEYDDDSLFGAGSPASSGVAFIEVPLITAMLIHVVLDLAEGRTPGWRDAMRKGLSVFGAVFWTFMLYLLGVLGGLLLLIVPGIYFAIRWYFSAQVVVVEGDRNTKALKRSSRLVQGSWWRVLGYGIVFQLVLIPLAFVALPFEIAAEEADRAVFSMMGSIFVNGISLSFVALCTTFLYFDLRARQEGAAAPEAQWPQPPQGTGDPLHRGPEAMPGLGAPPASTPPPVAPGGWAPPVPPPGPGEAAPPHPQTQPPPVMPREDEEPRRRDDPPPPQIFDPPRD